MQRKCHKRCSWKDKVIWMKNLSLLPLILLFSSYIHPQQKNTKETPFSILLKSISLTKREIMNFAPAVAQTWLLNWDVTFSAQPRTQLVQQQREAFNVIPGYLRSWNPNINKAKDAVHVDDYVIGPFKKLF